MSLLDDILRGLGVVGSRKARRRAGGPTLPDPNEIKEKLEEAVEGLSGLKDIPKTLMDRVVEANEDFQAADKALRGTRVRGRRK